MPVALFLNVNVRSLPEFFKMSEQIPMDYVSRLLGSKILSISTFPAEVESVSGRRSFAYFLKHGEKGGVDA